jgi:2-methylcitrate dehydratase PrpD
VNHAAIDGCIHLRNQFTVRQEEVEAIELRVHPLAIELTGKSNPKDGLEGKFSIFHSAAIAILDGAAGEAQYANARVCDPIVVALRQRVSAAIEPSLGKDEAHVSILLKDGRRIYHHVENALGSLAKPMSDSQLERKFIDLTDGALPPERVGQLVKLCWNIVSLDDVGDIARGAAAVGS